MFFRDHVLAPNIVRVEFALVPVLNILESMRLVSEAEDFTGLASWVSETAAHMPPEQLRKTKLVFNAFELILYEHMYSEQDSLETFLRELEAHDPVQLVESLWDDLANLPAKYPEHWMQDKPAPGREDIKNDAGVYADFMTAIYGDRGEHFWEEAYDLLQDPPRLLDLITEHLQLIYDEYVEVEWKRALPMLQESVAAFQKLDYSNLTTYEAIRAVTGRDLTGKLGDKVNLVESLVFMPTAHIGPYVGSYLREHTLYVIFGARLPRGVKSASSDLSRAELLIRLNALADDTRLRILELLTQHEEMCAQDIIERIGLSQPTISRHLSQLSATGYIVERRRDVAKCYSLNPERVTDTLRALESFLSRH